ncbi:MAG: hypothetical protein ACR2QV_03300 [Gammaproteobacteria bacterium]
MRSVALRPGRLLGAYPELPPDRVSQLGRAMRNLGTPATWLRSARDAKAKAFLRAVNDAGEPLRKFDAAQLDACTADLRAGLQRHGLRPDLTARAFALVREFASRTLDLRHFDEQVIGGWAILDGLVAEMDTGEGKTLTATLPACAAALAGIPVHVVTVNDYLAQRDRELMAPLYAILGVRVGVATPDMPDATRARAYACDVTYVTNKQVAFDYLRDRVAIGHRRAAVYRSIDRMSGRPDDGNAPNLLLRGLCFAIVDEADSVLIDEARTPLKLSGAAEDPIEAHVYRQAIDAARELDDAADWHIDSVGAVALVDAGRDRVARRVADADRYFLSPRRRNALIRQALTALHLFERDRHYLVRDGAIEIIDENTGRVMQDRTWEMGLHQLIEAKEGLAISRPAQTLARITYQRFFRRYLKLGAMTGTAREVAGELQSVYGLAVHRVPPHRASRRRILPAKIFATEGAKWDDVVARAIASIHERRPVLIGTKSVAASDALSAALNRAGISHELLNARQDEREAEIIARAGREGQITVATNMAGRGTDIALGPGVAERGGLHVVAAECNDSRRLDRQLFGRCARQGDPGSCEAVWSFSDESFVKCAPRPVKWLAKNIIFGHSRKRGPGMLLIRLVQWYTERRNTRLRRRLLQQDQRLDEVFGFSGPME